MTIVIALLVTMSVALFVFALAGLAPARAYEVRRRLANLREGGAARPAEKERADRRAQIETLLEQVGQKILRRQVDKGGARERLVRAGYYARSGVSLFYGMRILGTAAGGTVLGGLGWVKGVNPALTVMIAAIGAMIGWVLPNYLLKRKIRKRQKQLTKALPDTLDLLVVCVEAGLGLNQALLRVSEEIRHVSEVMSEELRIVNGEIRAGKPRDEALRNLGERTGHPDLRTLTAMLIQTDRFGTSVARALRIHADTMRTKRRQRAEEAAAKTTIKLVFPLVLFIFPAMFVVILGPAVLHIMNTLRGIS